MRGSALRVALHSDVCRALPLIAHPCLSSIASAKEDNTPLLHFCEGDNPALAWLVISKISAHVLFEANALENGRADIASYKEQQQTKVKAPNRRTPLTSCSNWPWKINPGRTYTLA